MLLCAYALGWHAPGVWVGMCLGFGATCCNYAATSEPRYPNRTPSPEPKHKCGDSDHVRR